MDKCTEFKYLQMLNAYSICEGAVYTLSSIPHKQGLFIFNNGNTIRSGSVKKKKKKKGKCYWGMKIISLPLEECMFCFSN